MSTSTTSSVAVAIDGGPAISFPSASPPSSSSSSSSSSARVNGPALHLAGDAPPAGAGTGARSGAGVAASAAGLPAPRSTPGQEEALPDVVDSADARALPESGFAAGGNAAGGSAVHSTPLARASGGSDSLFSSPPPMAGKGVVERVGAAEGGGQGMHSEELVEAVTARVTEVRKRLHEARGMLHRDWERSCLLCDDLYGPPGMSAEDWLTDWGHNANQDVIGCLFVILLSF